MKNNEKFIARLPKQKIDTEPVKLKFLSDVQSGKQILRAYGILGEKSGSDAYVEEIIKPETGGTFLKLYGISYLFKGAVPRNEVYSLELVKFLVFSIPREKIVQVFSILSFLFARRWFYKKIYDLLWNVDHRTVSKIDTPGIEGCETVRELKRAVSQSLMDKFKIDLSRPFYHVDHPRYHKDRRFPDPKDLKNNYLGWIMVLVARFIFVFLELDTAYRFRFQDAFGSGEKEFWKIIELLISRETKFGVGHKWKFVKTALKIGFFLVPDLKRFMARILKNLDLQKVKMDEADWYYALGYRSYDFGGKTREWRYAERERLDKLKDHVSFFSNNVL